MQWFWAGMFPAAAVPAGCVSAAALALWVGRHAAGAGTGALAFVGWVEMLFVLVTVAAIIWTAAVPDEADLDGIDARKQPLPGVGTVSSGQKILLGYALLADSAALMVALVGMAWAGLSWKEAIALFVLLLSWSGLWCAAAWGLRRWGPGLSAAIPLVLSTILMAAPVGMMPVVHAAAHWGQRGGDAAGKEGAAVMWQGRVVEAVGLGNPLLASLDAMHPAVRIDWATLPGMYAQSGLGQEVPMALPRWWVNALAYAVTAGVIWMLSLVLRARARIDL